jgi:hypothetical protein
VVLLLDVDKTLLDNDRVQDDLRAHPARTCPSLNTLTVTGLPRSLRYRAPAGMLRV